MSNHLSFKIIVANISIEIFATHISFQEKLSQASVLIISAEVVLQQVNH